uniref:(California timema) hypothetical protein n=1 Tax=Timema californicum TaxID=61474 RepID=A0A7R9JAS5_TIMCA|nr:unnamed protein product [Timema californicum]
MVCRGLLTILQRQLGMHPLIVLKDMQFCVLKSLIEFMYCGETSVTEDNLQPLLQAAKFFQSVLTEWFMYCGETSVTEDNLQPLLEAAKFFQVKGLSAMSKEALNIASANMQKPGINGDAARKAFVGRSKRVGIQQSLVPASGMKATVSGESAPSTVTSNTTSTAAKTTFQLRWDGGACDKGQPVFLKRRLLLASTVSDSITTTSCLLVLYLVASPPSSVSIDAQSGAIDSIVLQLIFNVASRSVPVQQQQQQKTDTAQLLLSLSGGEFNKQQQTSSAPMHTVSKNIRLHNPFRGDTSKMVTLDHTGKDTISIKGEVVDRIPILPPGTNKSETKTMYMADAPRRRGRPLKRAMNLVFKEKVLSETDLALQKEAENSRKALEALQQEIKFDNSNQHVTARPNTSVQSGSKGQGTNQGNSKVLTPPRAEPPAPQTIHEVKDELQSNTIFNVAGNNVTTTNAAGENVIYQIAEATNLDGGNGNIVYKVGDQFFTAQGTNADGQMVFQLAENALTADGENVVYQVADEGVDASQDSNTDNNVVYQVSEADNTSNTITNTNSNVSQCMEVLKEAGLPTDVPILLDSGDGQYITVNEEVLMNIVNGGMIQVSDGNIVGGEGLQFIVQEVAEEEDVPATAETTSVTADNPSQDEGEKDIVSSDGSSRQPERRVYKSAGEGHLKRRLSQNISSLPSLDDASIEDNVTSILPDQTMNVDEPSAVVGEGKTNTEISDNQDVTSTDAISDEVITGDSYGEMPTSGFIVRNASSPVAQENYLQQDNNSDCTVGGNFIFQEESLSNEDVVQKTQDAVMALETQAATIEDNDRSGVMSVEQALEAMMGETSDTEDASKDARETIQDPTSQPQPENQGQSTDEETQDLRLVLSPEEGQIVGGNQSPEDSLNESFTLALTPDSTGNRTESGDMSNLQQISTVDSSKSTTDFTTTLEDEVNVATSTTTTTSSVVTQEVVDSTQFVILADSTLQENNMPNVESTTSLEYDNANLGQIKSSQDTAQNVQTSDFDSNFVDTTIVEQEGEVSESVHLTQEQEQEQELDDNGIIQKIDEMVAYQGEVGITKDLNASPSKDVPYAVGLLPLRTALDKLQTLPEYHPRKTRALIKDSPETPGTSIKRKASSTVEGTDKKQRLSDEELETTAEETSGVLPSMVELVTDGNEG